MFWGEDIEGLDLAGAEEDCDFGLEGAGEDDFTSSVGGGAAFFADLGALSSGGISRVDRSSSASASTPILEPTVTPLDPSSTCRYLSEVVGLW